MGQVVRTVLLGKSRHCGKRSYQLSTQRTVGVTTTRTIELVDFTGVTGVEAVLNNLYLVKPNMSAMVIDLASANWKKLDRLRGSRRR
ncbi:hypothetical protein GOBAR_AA37350 [Gossypium barbadense]|uniref:Uncharacterized protein n=1 Tax=Gossypium barbadense TaxID=3634 RepID=A0A2P5VX00_GOSBA|nr:hypothetical protein GOBAR_AA37350 [Gossypium barbadense]